MAHDYELWGVLILAGLGALPIVPSITFAVSWMREKDATRRHKTGKRFVCASSMAALLYAGVAIDGYLIEPNWPKLSSFEITANVSESLRILHLSDLHIEKDFPRRERWLLNMIATLSPDLILITGDLHQMDNLDGASIGRVLSPLKAPLGIFACVGYDNVHVVEDASPNIRYFSNEVGLLSHGKDRIALAGLLSVGDRNHIYKDMENAPCRIVMNHTPDLADEASGKGVDLYCCGHTHGGQVRIPFWGAVITNSVSGKKYEAGLYRQGRTCIFTSRGLGLEPPPAPQVRFLCRPEITMITIRPAGGAA